MTTETQEQFNTKVKDLVESGLRTLRRSDNLDVVSREALRRELLTAFFDTADRWFVRGETMLNEASNRGMLTALSLCMTMALGAGHNDLAKTIGEMVKELSK